MKKTTGHTATDNLHLLYSLPGLEMAAGLMIERINQIRSLLNQPPWDPGIAPPALDPEPTEATKAAKAAKAAKATKAKTKRKAKAAKAAEPTPEPEAIEPEPEPQRHYLSPRGRAKLRRLMKQRWVEAKANGAATLHGPVN